MENTGRGNLMEQRESLYLNDEYLTEITNDFNNTHDFSESKQEIVDIANTVRKFMLKQQKEETALLEKFYKKVKEDIFNNVKRIRVSFDQFVADGAFECTDDVEPEYFDDNRNLTDDDKKIVRKMYNKLVKMDSEDIYEYTSDVFKAYSKTFDEPFCSLKELEDEVDDMAENDPADFYEYIVVPRIWELQYIMDRDSIREVCSDTDLTKKIEV